MAAHQLLRSCTAELEQLAASISSSRDLASLSDQRPLLQHMNQLLATYQRQPPQSFDGEQQAFMLAAVKLLPALADGHHARDRTWVVLLCDALNPWDIAEYVGGVVSAQYRAQLTAWFGQHGEWLLLAPAGAAACHQSAAVAPYTRPVRCVPAGAAALPSITRLLEGVRAAAASSSATLAEQGSAALCLMLLTRMIHNLGGGLVDHERLLPALTAALDLASLLVNGDRGDSGPLGCSCCLAAGGSSSGSAAGGSGAAAAPVLSPQRAALPLPHCQASVPALQTGYLLCAVLGWLAGEHKKGCKLYGHALADHQGGWLLCVQQFAVCLLHLRRLRAASGRQGGRGSSGRGRGGTSASSSGGSGGGTASVPACADPAAFLGGAGPAALGALLQDFQEEEAVRLLVLYALNLLALLWTAAASGQPMCACCTPAQLLVVVEAVTMAPEYALRFIDTQGPVFRVYSKLIKEEAPTWPWQAAYQQKACPALAAWAVAVAQQLPVRPASGSGVFALDDAVAELGMHVATVILNVNHATLGVPELERHVGVPLATLLACTERALRMQPAWRDQALCVDAGLSLMVVSHGDGGAAHRAPGWAAATLLLCARCGGQSWRRQECRVRSWGEGPGRCWLRRRPGTCGRAASLLLQGLHTSGTFRQLWRGGVLPSLLVTFAKQGASADMRRATYPTRRIDNMALLLMTALPEFGVVPWFAHGREEQEFALLLVVHVGTRLAVRLQQLAALPPPEQQVQASDLQHMAAAVDAVHAAARQVGRPPLRQLLEVAAAGLMPAADAVNAAGVFPYRPPAGARGYEWAASALQRQHVQLLADLCRQLDPLALGLALPGCYNPACTSLAGAGEADMKLKRCTACKIARWAGGGLTQ